MKHAIAGLGIFMLLALAAEGGEPHWLGVPAGIYRLGAADVEAGLVPHTDSLATLPAFSLGRDEVSNQEFCEFLNAGNAAHFDRRMEIHDLGGGHFRCIESFERLPVHHVAWRSAAAYCRWVGGRLPSAAEWEAAARGREAEEQGATRFYPWGPEPTEGRAGNCQETQRAGQRYAWPADSAASLGPFGHANLGGNLAEWTAESDADSSWAQVKGGSWADPEIDLRSAIVVHRPADKPSALIGFRVAR